MHCHAIPSILDESSEAIQRVLRRLLGGTPPSIRSQAPPRAAFHISIVASQILKEEVEIVLVSPKVFSVNENKDSEANHDPEP
jgi:hypothetical protein